MTRTIIDLLFVVLIIAAVIVYYWQKKDRDARQKLRDQLEDLYHYYGRKY